MSLTRSVSIDSFEQERRELVKRLEWLAHKPEGILYYRRRPTGSISIEKVGSQIHLRFFSDYSSEVQSRLDPEEPYNLLSPYTRAMMLGLVWRPQPNFIHVIGLGGGRIPMILHSHFPDLTIECTETDPDVYELATEYFGFQTDSNLKVFIEDAREFLEARSSQPLYDLIMVDAFTGVGFGPLRLATREFYEICKKQLQPGGLVVVNFLLGDQLMREKISTIRRSFTHTYKFQKEGTIILFAHDGHKSDESEFIETAKQLERQHRFAFEFAPLASHIVRFSVVSSAISGAEESQILTDTFSSEVIHIEPGVLKQLGRNERCPCGSGKKYKKCHGQG